MIIFWFPLYLLLIIIFNTILISPLSPCSIELHDLTISEHKISSATSMLPSTLPLLSVFFPALSLLSEKADIFSLLTSTSGWFYPFSRGHSLQKDAFAVLYICFPPINFAHLPSVRWWMIHECHISHHVFTCEAFLSNNYMNIKHWILWSANPMALVKVYSVADRSKVHRVKVRSCSGWQAKVGYYSIRSFFLFT